MIQRSTSDGSSSPSSTMWRFGGLKNKFRSNDESKTSHAVHEDPSRETLSADHNASGAAHDSPEANLRHLQSLTQKMRSAPSGLKDVDAAHEVFKRIKDHCAVLCKALLQADLRPRRSMSNATETSPRIDSSFDSSRPPGTVMFDHRSSFSGLSLAEVVSNGGTTGGPPSTSETLSRQAHVNDAHLAAIRDWKHCVENLVDTFHTSLIQTYKSYERDATPEMIELFFTDKKYRRDAINRMHYASVTRVMSADPQFFPRYQIRFRNYEDAKKELGRICDLLHAAESGISPSQRVEDISIAPRGDSMMEFVNNTPEALGNEPVLRFRVSSQALAETSPIFARMFSGHPASKLVHEDEDITAHLPASPSIYNCKDGSKVRLYRMPQYELNREDSLTILLHAGHGHNEVVPHEVTYERFVAIAECCIRYRCTAPLEAVVEHSWLPHWMHKGATDLPDGLLVISYAFGLRQLFTRMSRSAILSIVDEKDLYGKPWPSRLRDKVWAVRSAKLAQVYAHCTNTIQEYIRQPAGGAVLGSAEAETALLGGRNKNGPGNFSPSAPPKNAVALTSASRCPKGSHSCDAANLGWLMLMLNELGLLPQLMRPDALTHLPEAYTPSRSLAQTLDALRRVPSPPEPIHRGGVCDPGPAFRSALNDIFDSVTGLTLYDVSGKSHGWALSKPWMDEPQRPPGLELMDAHDHNHSVMKEFPDKIRHLILAEIDDLADLRAAALMSQAFYNTYKAHEMRFMQNILRSDRTRPGPSQPHPRSLNNRDGKVRTEDMHKIMQGGSRRVMGALALGSDDEPGSSDLDSDPGDVISIASDALESPAAGSGARRHAARGSQRRRVPRSPEGGDVSRLAKTLRYPASPPTSPPARRSPPISSTPRGSSGGLPNRPSAEPTKDVVPMTREEAEKILWPDSPNPDDEMKSSSKRRPPSLDKELAREKVWLGDPHFIKGFEEKTLIFTSDKQLRGDLHQKIGFGNRKDLTGSSSSGKTR